MSPLTAPPRIEPIDAANHFHVLYDKLFQAHSPMHWWPGDSPFEVILGAILTQNTAWRNVEQALGNLRQQSLLDPQRLVDLPLETLQTLIRPSGYFNQKGIKIKAFLAYFAASYDLSIVRMQLAPLEQLRCELLKIWGIGKETADSILLYALEKPIFVIDAYTLRIGSRHRLFPDNTDYDEAQRLFMAHLPASTALYNEYHALLVKAGNNSCGPRPRCAGCTLESLLPVA